MVRHVTLSKLDSMAHLWLILALVFYGLAALAASATLGGRLTTPLRWLAPLFAAGAFFNFVSLVESTVQNGKLMPVDLVQSESSFALLLSVVFLATYSIWRTEWPGVLVAPPVFLLTLASAMGAHTPASTVFPDVPARLIYVHIVLIFTGYAALVLSFTASILYLLQEHNLKSKQLFGFTTRMPALATLDEISERALQAGFPFMTFGLAAGVAVVQQMHGPMSIFEPKILLSILFWILYLFLLFVRWKAGIRGRNAALLASFATVLAGISWVAHYLSTFNPGGGAQP